MFKFVAVATIAIVASATVQAEDINVYVHQVPMVSTWDNSPQAVAQRRAENDAAMAHFEEQSQKAFDQSWAHSVCLSQHFDNPQACS